MMEALEFTPQLNFLSGRETLCDVDGELQRSYIPQQYLGKLGCVVHRDEGHFVATLLGRNAVSLKKKLRSTETQLVSDCKAVYSEGLKESFGHVSKSFRHFWAKKYATAKILKTFEGAEKAEALSALEEASGKVRAAYHARMKRFKRKVLLHIDEWQYFVTITRDDRKYASEEAFRAAVDRCFSNLHTRRGWRQMGVWERGEENGRLHYHAIVSIPEGQMVGELRETNDYSVRAHRRQISTVNTWFEKRFGRNDFEAIEAERGEDDYDARILCKALDYITKYMEKSGENIRYSRGIVSEIVRELDPSDFLVDDFRHHTVQAVVLDRQIDWRKILETYTRKEGEYLRENYRDSVPILERLRELHKRRDVLKTVRDAELDRLMMQRMEEFDRSQALCDQI